MAFAEVHSLALFNLTRQADMVFDQSGDLFDAYAYSRFKYGSAYMSKQYAQALCVLLRERHPELWQTSALWLTSSAYKFVPTASDSLAKYLFKYLSHTLQGRQAPVIEPVKIARTRLFPADYGNLTQQERKAIMQQVDLYFEQPLPAQQADDLVIVDDIRITGAHEHRLLEFAKKEGFKRIYFVYIAHLSPKSDPTTEHWLNHMAVRDLRDLWDLWSTEGCLLNARICKFLLSYPDKIALTQFAKALPQRLSSRIAEGMWQDGYAEMALYTAHWEIWEAYKKMVVIQ